MRLQKMMLKLQPYSMEVVYKKGKDIPIPDALSRLYVPQQGDKLIDDEVMVSVAEVCFSPDRQTELKGIYPEFQVIRGFSQKIPAGVLSYNQIHS